MSLPQTECDPSPLETSQFLLIGRCSYGYICLTLTLLDPSPLTLGLQGQKTWLSCFFCPTAPCLGHSNCSVDACWIKEQLLWDTSLQFSSFPMANSAFSSQQPLIHGLKLPGRPFPQDHGAAVPRRPGLHRPEPAPEKMESFWFCRALWLLSSSCLALVFLGRRKPSVTTSSSIYRHICIFVILFTKWQCSQFRKEEEKKSWGPCKAKRGMWDKVSRASWNISVHIREWKTLFLPLLHSHLCLNLYH